MTKVLHTSLGIEICRPADEVWAYVSAYANDTEWRRGITEMTADTAGTPRVGTKVREVLKLGAHEYITDTEVTDVGPGMHYRFAGAGTSGPVRGARTVVRGDAPGSARFTYEVDVEPDHLPRLVRPLLLWWLQRGFRRDLEHLRDLFETRVAA